MKRRILSIIVALVFSLSISFADWVVAPPRPPFYKRWYYSIKYSIYDYKWSENMYETRELSKGFYIVDTLAIVDPIVMRHKDGSYYVCSKKKAEKSKRNKAFYESPNVYIMLDGVNHFDNFSFSCKNVNAFYLHKYIARDYPSEKYDFPSLGLFHVKLNRFMYNSLGLTSEDKKKKLKYYHFAPKQVIFLMALINTMHFDQSLITMVGDNDPSQVHYPYPNNRYIKVVFPVYIADDSEHTVISQDSVRNIQKKYWHSIQ